MTNFQVDQHRTNLCLSIRVISYLFKTIFSAKELLRTDLPTKEQNKYTEYAIYSYVLVHYRTGLPHTSWEDPIKVIEGFNSHYTLLDLITGKEIDFHVSDMKQFVFDSAVVDPMDVAHRDYMEYFVDKILQHRGNPKKSSSSMEFEASWLNYPPDSNAWEPYKNLRQCGPLHVYLTKNNLAKLIPPKFRLDIAYPEHNLVSFEDFLPHLL